MVLSLGSQPPDSNAIYASCMNPLLVLRAIALLTLMMLVTAGNALADTRADVGEISPADGTELAVGTSLYVRVDYETDQPVTLWARPFLNGKPVQRAMSNASETYSGSGRALGWFALTQAGAVDEIRILAGGGAPYREWQVTSVPVQFNWSAGGRTADASPPEWVSQLQSESAARSAARAKHRANEPVPVTDIALFNGFMLLMLALLIGSIALPVRSVWRWRGGWRIAAGVPLILMAFVVLRIVSDTTRDPTSHNLWPFEILMFGGVAIVVTVALMVVRRLLNAKKP
jgi:hypothetical protein